jgi:hypothetical protein
MDDGLHEVGQIVAVAATFGKNPRKNPAGCDQQPFCRSFNSSQFNYLTIHQSAYPSGIAPPENGA